MYFYKSLIVLVFLLFNTQAYTHYFSESFSKWNITGSDISANFSILELKATRILQLKDLHMNLRIILIKKKNLSVLKLLVKKLKNL